MLRRALFSLVGVALAALLTIDSFPTVSAAESEVAGNWLLMYSTRGGTEQAFAIIKVELKDGKPVASVLYTPLKVQKLEVSKFRSDGKTVKFETSVGWAFEGTLDKDGQKALGSFGPEQSANRARLARTDKTELAANEVIARLDPPTPVAESQKLTSAVLLLRNQIAREKDATKKKDLAGKAGAAQKEADEKLPALLREVVAKHADTPFALDAAVDLIRNGTKYKLTADEATKLLTLIEQQSTPFGARFVQFQTIAAVESLVTQKGLEGVAEGPATRLAKASGTSAEFRARVLSARKTALESLGKTEDVKAVTAELAKLETELDTEYLAKVPPFKATAFAGRKDKNANQVAVMELFTGAQCPPCVAADVAFDALTKSYKPTELVLIQYHMHIPGPDPLTNPDTVARWDYYRKEFPDDIRGTPTTLFNGKPLAGGGGGMTNAENKYKQYAEIIDPLLEKTTDVKVAGKVSRTGDKLNIAVEVAGASDDLKLRLLVVEENVKYVGGNRLRFHHQVVRAMPGGADGVAIKEKVFKHTTTSDLAEVRKGLNNYLDDYAANTRPFPKPERPLDLKAVRVIALVQNDKTREIVQAAQIEVEGKADNH